MRRLLACLVAVLVASPVVSTAQAASAATTPAALVIGGDFPDPDVIKVGSTYYAYSTNNGFGNVPVATAASLGGPWTRRPDALPTLGAWADGGRTWAPDVSPRADGRYLLYYTARSRAAGRQCIGVALASSPLGPFAPVGTGPLVCNGGEGGDIDASSFVDGTGLRYLLYKDDGNAVGQPTSLWLQRVAADGVTLQGARVELLRNDRPEEAGIVEAPVLTRVGARYVLFYSLGGYGGDGYQTSYATATSLTGPYTRAYRSLLTTASVDGAVRGPGGADVVREAGGDHLVFHGWINNYTARGMYVAALGWAGEYPVVRGSRVRYEAERGTLNHCAVRNTASASQGQVVAYLDYADSWVDVTVFAPRAGGYTAHLAYAAGYGDATHMLTVNGGAAQVVSYPNSGWENWRQVRADVTLNAGFNTLRLTHRDGWAELDFVEVA
ncbi:Extracellular endo-alpha-(1-_5)-L-arabinanase 1 precursor [Micromonospora sp. MW-13]|uniref:family 43 glycosylhydrolase n=1 Tax=Micromonospora sp. MW-13 TaxID=2094022 RepID=UPI000E42F8F9|nr:family 43 glycosylhydrolase [Micromonospora sp. MW-13]RGC69257.1 Extracellular endo-alpha-(1->5)-L-arabinanase 1 precursor [Micromonospora sp. MW-13]